MLQKERIDFVIPVFNESPCIPELVGRLHALEGRLRETVDLTFIFVDDGSSDDTFDQLRRHAEQYPSIKLIRLTRNFGHQMAITAGLDYSSGDYVCIIDGDLQDPPELVEEMYRKARAEDLDVVYGQRQERWGERWFKKVSAACFYRVLRLMCNVDIPPETGDFRLVRRAAVDAFRQMRERHRFIRGMVPWLGFRSAPLSYERDPRFAGKTKFPLRRMLRFAADAIFSFSNIPLRCATYAGLLLCAFAGLFLAYMLMLKLFTDRVVPGLMVILTLQVFLGGFQILLLGIVGEYIGRIFEETKKRPLYVVQATCNIEEREGRNVVRIARDRPEKDAVDRIQRTAEGA